MKCNKCGKTIAGTETWYNMTTKRSLCWGHNLKLSELEKMHLDEISVDDIILITDVDKKESKTITVGMLVDYIKSK